MNNKLLVIEDDPGLQSQIRWCFENYDVLLAGDRESGTFRDTERFALPASVAHAAGSYQHAVRLEENAWIFGCRHRHTRYGSVVRTRRFAEESLGESR